jgi:hypothetical protein
MTTDIFVQSGQPTNRPTCTVLTHLSKHTNSYMLNGGASEVRVLGYEYNAVPKRNSLISFEIYKN